MTAEKEARALLDGEGSFAEKIRWILQKRSLSIEATKCCNALAVSRTSVETVRQEVQKYAALRWPNNPGFDTIEKIYGLPTMEITPHRACQRWREPEGTARSCKKNGTPGTRPLNGKGVRPRVRMPIPFVMQRLRHGSICFERRSAV